MPHVDSSGVSCLEALRKRLAQNGGKTLVLCEFNGPCRDILAKAGFTYDADCAQPPAREELEEAGGATTSKAEAVAMFLSLNDAVLHAADVVKAGSASSSTHSTLGCLFARLY